MNNILAIDTATKVLSVSLSSDNIIYENTIDEGFTHSEKLLPLIDSLLIKAKIKIDKIDLLVCTRGPGSFTGLRIGMATLKGISTALNIPLISIPSLDLYAFKKENFSGIVLPIIDARKKSFYTAIFRNETKETQDLDLTRNDIINLLTNEQHILLTGPDSAMFYEKCLDDKRFILDTDITNNHAVNLIKLGIKSYKKYGPDDRDQGPLYIRKSEAEIHLLNKNNL